MTIKTDVMGSIVEWYFNFLFCFEIDKAVYGTWAVKA